MAPYGDKKKIIFTVFFRVSIMKAFDDNTVPNPLSLLFVLRHSTRHKRLEELALIDSNKIQFKRHDCMFRNFVLFVMLSLKWRRYTRIK